MLKLCLDLFLYIINTHPRGYVESLRLINIMCVSDFILSLISSWESGGGLKRGLSKTRLECVGHVRSNLSQVVFMVVFWFFIAAKSILKKWLANVKWTIPKHTT